jgi:hypothetical protein
MQAYSPHIGVSFLVDVKLSLNINMIQIIKLCFHFSDRFGSIKKYDNRTFWSFYEDYNAAVAKKRSRRCDVRGDIRTVYGLK